MHLRVGLTAVEMERELFYKLSDASKLLLKEKFGEILSQDTCDYIFRDIKDD